MVNELSALIKKLEKERDDHVRAIEEIEATFESLGINTSSAKPKAKRGRPAGSTKKKATKKASAKKKRGGKRKSFAKTGDQSVIDFVKSHPKATTKDINVHWSKEGRGGRADNALTKLVQNGVLKRAPIKNGRGAMYTVVK